MDTDNHNDSDNQPPHHTPPPFPPAEPAAGMADNGAVNVNDGIGHSTSASPPQGASLSSFVLASPAAVAVFPYPTFAERSAVDDDGCETGDDDDDHWLDLALSSNPVRASTTLSPAAAAAYPTAAAVTSALSLLRAAHSFEVERQQLSSSAWQTVKQQTRQHILDSYGQPTPQGQVPSAATIASLTAEDGQPANQPTNQPTNHPTYHATAPPSERADDAALVH